MLGGDVGGGTVPLAGLGWYFEVVDREERVKTVGSLRSLYTNRQHSAVGDSFLHWQYSYI